MRNNYRHHETKTSLCRTLTNHWPVNTKRNSIVVMVRTAQHSPCKLAVSYAPEFHDKPHIVQRDGGNVIVIKVRAKSHLEMKAEWFKVTGNLILRIKKVLSKESYTYDRIADLSNDKPVKFDDRIKSVVKKDDKDKEGFQYLLEITGPKKEDEGKYKCVVKNAEGQNE
uniref:Immunoglobulin I-set domain-containing protein n=1 Tax=Parascaris equorum TaxID=6256 RepID=A0A914S061_PAREQ